jgi:anaerobic selenocysteine-containing dehydrogenase
MFENSVPGLPDAAADEGLDPLGYMRKYGAFEVARDIYEVHERPADPDQAVLIDGEPKTGFNTPSKKLEWYSKTMDDWGWSDESIPTYLRSHVNWRDLDLAGNERILLPIFRLPTLIHTRSGNAKYLYEISHGHPLWINPSDADALGFETGQMVRLTTDIGWFVMRAWRTEGIRPGVVAASHHLGRWRLNDEQGNERWSSALVDQNLAFPVHPDPVSGQHAWHQRVRLTAAADGDRYGDVVVDTAKSTAVFEEWLTKTKPGPGPDGTRRPMWLARPVKPTPDAYRF